MRRVRTVSAAAAAAVLALTLSACGSSSSDSGSSGQSDGQTQSGSTQESSGGSSAAGSGSGSAQSTGSSSTAQGSSTGGDTSVCTGASGDRVPDKLVLALVPSGNAKKLVQTVKPLTAALTKRLGIPVSGVVTQDYQAAVEAIGANKADIGFLPSLQMSQACERYHAVPALQTERGDRSSYAGEFFTNDPDKYCTTKPKADKNGMLFCNGTMDGLGPAGLDSLSKVKGATFSFLHAASPAGYIFPAHALKTHGIDPVHDVKPIQVTSNKASVLAVYKGDAEVGVAYWDARTVVSKDTPDVGKKLVVFALTKMIPNDGVSLNGTLTSQWQDKIKKALLDYAGTDAGVKTLESIYQISGLTQADPKQLQETQDIAQSIGLGG